MMRTIMPVLLSLALILIILSIRPPNQAPYSSVKYTSARKKSSASESYQKHIDLLSKVDKKNLNILYAREKARISADKSAFNRKDTILVTLTPDYNPYDSSRRLADVVAAINAADRSEAARDQLHSDTMTAIAAEQRYRDLEIERHLFRATLSPRPPARLSGVDRLLLHSKIVEDHFTPHSYERNLELSSEYYHTH